MSDLVLLREAMRWARANGYRYDGTGRQKVWDRSDGGTTIVGVETVRCHHEGCDHDTDLHVIEDGIETTTSASSVQRALDILVALGVLPARFSSAYAIGQAAACIHVLAAASGGDA
jgi:hypothetical protein